MSSYVQQDLFDGTAVIETRPVNVASVPHRSPFRYPGGKTWFVPRLRQWLANKTYKAKLLVEPFAGGGIISLTAAFEDLVDNVLMVELDSEVAAVWETILYGDTDWLVSRILQFEMTTETVVEVINSIPRSKEERAFQTIVKNRTAHGGILADGAGLVKNGEAGKGIRSRWYPGTLARRIRNIALVAPKIEFQQGEALAILNGYKSVAEVVYFIDPPYTAGGKNAGSRLYNHSNIDHDELFQICKGLQGDFIMTYDNSDEVKELAQKHSFQAKPIPMKNTHHAEMTELVIGRDLSWMADITRVCEEPEEYKAK